MATNLSAHSVIHNGPSRSAVVVESENRLIAVVDSLIHIGKLQHNKRHEELTVLENSVIDLGAYLSALQIPWPKPMDRLGTVLVEILECGQKLWSTRWYFAVNPRMPTKKPDQIEDELERELYPEQTALAEETERERIETERDKYANEDRYYHSRLSSQLRTMTQWPETKLREMQSRGSEIICEMIDPCNTDQNRGEPDPPKLPKVQPSLTNPIVTGDSLAPPSRAAETPTAKRDAPAGVTEQPPVVATPSTQFIPLTGWDEIIAALNEPHGNAAWKQGQATKAKIRKLNDRFNGPINFPKKKGAQPYVGKSDLMSWLGRVEADFADRTEEIEANAKSERLTVSETHNYGAAGTVIPGISGSVKPSRATGEKGKEGKR